MGNGRKADEMNPHKLFASIMLVSVAATIAGFASGGDSSGLYGMMEILAITLACVGIVLFATRRYWRNTRRMT